MKKRLNITNGESAVTSLREAGIQGDIIPSAIKRLLATDTSVR